MRGVWGLQVNSMVKIVQLKIVLGRKSSRSIAQFGWKGGEIGLKYVGCKCLDRKLGENRAGIGLNKAGIL